MNYTEKENIKQLDNKKEQSKNIIASVFDFVKAYDEDTTDKEIKNIIVEKFECCSLEEQVLTLDFVCDVFMKIAKFGLKFEVCGPNLLCKSKAQI